MSTNLLERAEELKSKMQSLIEAGNDLTEREANDLAGYTKEFKGLQAQLAASGAIDSMTADLSTADGTFTGAAPWKAYDESVQPVDSRLAGQSPAMSTKEYMVRSLGENTYNAISTKAYYDAFRAYLGSSYHRIGAGDMKTLQLGDDQSGGFLAPAQYLQTLIMKRPAPTRVLGNVTQLTTSRDSLLVPCVVYDTDDIYQTGIRTTTTGEIPASSTVHQMTDPVFGNIELAVRTEMVSGQVTRDMIEDSAFDVVGFVSEQMGTVYNLKKESKVVAGTGVSEPLGFITAPDTTVAGHPQITSIACADPIDGVKLLQVPFNISEQYEDEELKWVFNKTDFAQYLVGLKDTTGRPIFGYGMGDNGLASAKPTMLCGYEFVYSKFMPNRATNAFPAAFGWLKSYALVERVGFAIQTLMETKAKDNQIELVGRGRFGGGLLQPWGLKAAKQA